jgi:arylformamidase
MSSLALLDISLPITAGMITWPGDPCPTLEPTATLEHDGVQVSRLVLGTHTGTHLDVPRHFIAGGRTIDQLDLRSLIGPCCVIEMTPDVHVTAKQLRRFDLLPGIRLLLKTANSRRPPKPAFQPDFVALDPSAADYLCGLGAQLVGIDGPSVDAWTATDFPCHKRLLAAEILILENLVLHHVEPGGYGLIAIPLNLVGADGCPVRAVLTPSSALSSSPS